MIRNAIRSLFIALVAPLAIAAAGHAEGQTAAQLSNWLYQYTTGDMGADANNDGLLTPADFNAFIYAFNDGEYVPPGPTNSNEGGTHENENEGEYGWTDLEPSGDSRLVYVSWRTGNDNNDGLSQTRPVRTLDRAYSLIRDGYPDWILIERGGTYVDSFPNWRKSGRSSAEPMVVTTYGNSTLRPAIHTGSSTGLPSAWDRTRSHLRFMGLRLYPHQRSSTPTGMSFVGPVEDVLIEDCYVFGYAIGIVFQGDEDARSSDVRIRRTIVGNSWATGQHSEGIFIRSTDGIAIEGCVIDHNGWHPQFPSQSRTIFNHNVYIQRDVTGLTFRDNFVARGSSHGLQARNGGIVEGNVFYQNPISILWGNGGDVGLGDQPIRGRVADNAVLEGVDLLDQGRGWGIHIQNAMEGRVSNNILANSKSVSNTTWGISVRGPDQAKVRNLDISGNVVYDWYNSVSIADENAVSVRVAQNQLVGTDSLEQLVDHRNPETLDNVVYYDNKYFQADSSTDWFRVNFRDTSLSDWRSQRDPQGDVLPSPNVHFPNAGWTLTEYALANGYSSAESFLSELRAQRRGIWREHLTTRSVLNAARGAYGLPALP